MNALAPQSFDENRLVQPDHLDWIEIVRLRVLEAADTVLHMQMAGCAPSKVRSYWPELNDQHRYSSEKKYRPDASAISRFEEMLGWIAEAPLSEEERNVLINWSHAMVRRSHKYSFARWCKQAGINRRTATRRLQAGLVSLTQDLQAKQRTVRLPFMERIAPFMGKDYLESDSYKRVSFWRAEGAVSTIEAGRAIDYSWADKQRKMREGRRMRNATDAAEGSGQ